MFSCDNNLRNFDFPFKHLAKTGAYLLQEEVILTGETSEMTQTKDIFSKFSIPFDY